MVQLYDWQRPSRDKLVEIFRSGSLIAVNASDTGTGKTVCALDVARTLGWRPLVIAPKAVRSSWINMAKAMGCADMLLDVINPEKLLHKQPWFHDNKWHLPADSMVIWDEVTRGTLGWESKTTEIAARLKVHKIPVLAMSATIAGSPLQMRCLGYWLGWHSYSKSSFFQWAFSLGCVRNNWRGVDFPRTKKNLANMDKLHQQMAPVMSRIRIADLKEFPECDRQVKLFDLGKKETDEMNELYDEMEEKILKHHGNPLVETLFLRQHIEYLKVPLLHQLAMETLEEDMSPIIFVCFRDTMAALKALFDKQGIAVSLIHGVQGEREQAERDAGIAKFQSNEVNVCIAMTQAGGIGISMHDLNGRPRRSFINISYNAIELKQVFGRDHRAGSLSKSVQTIVLAAGTIEEKIHAALAGKLRNMDTLNDGITDDDLLPIKRGK